METLNLFFLTLAGIFILVTLLPFIGTTAWWVRIFDFPRAQIAMAGIVILITCLLLGDRSSFYENVILGALGLSAFYQGYRMAPYTLLGTKQVQGSETGAGTNSFRLMISNVLMSNRNADRLLAVVQTADPDLLLTVETDTWWEQHLQPLETAYPHQVKHPLDHLFHSDHFRLLHIERLPHVGSGHFPVLIELSYEPQGQIEQPEATPEEEKEAQKRIEEGLQKQADEPASGNAY